MAEIEWCGFRPEERMTRLEQAFVYFPEELTFEDWHAFIRECNSRIAWANANGRPSLAARLERWKARAYREVQS